MAATGSTQRYKRQLDQLEHSLTAKLQELSLLEQENEILKQQERALSSYISSVEGGVAVTAHILKKKGSSGAAAAAAGVSLQSPTVSGDSTAAAAAGDVQRWGDADILERIESKEREIQKVLRQLEAGPYETLYSTQLLHTASSNPEATALLLAAAPTQRRQHWTNKVEKIALLLPKYDHPEFASFRGPTAAAAAAGSSGSSSSSVSAQEVVDRLVDDLATELLVTGLLDPPQLTLYNFMVNLSTGAVVDAYPEGFWQHVAQDLKLDDKQLKALHISWRRVKSEKLALTAQHEAVLARLNQLRAQLRLQSQQFEQQTHQVMQQPPDPHEEIVQRRQQQQQHILAQQQQQQQQQNLGTGLGLDGDVLDPLGDWDIENLLQDMADDDQHQHWTLLQDLEQQQQQENGLLRLPGLDRRQHQELASFDVATLAVDVLAHNVITGFDDDGDDNDPITAASPNASSTSPPPQQQHEQRDLSSPGPAVPSSPGTTGITAAAAVAAAFGSGQSDPQQPQQQQESGPLTDWQDIVTKLQEIQQHVGSCTEQHEHFVPVGSKEQQQLERELNRIRGRIKMQHYCSALFWVNTLSKKQLASLYVLSWPFMPDGFALSEQLEADATPTSSNTTS